MGLGEPRRNRRTFPRMEELVVAPRAHDHGASAGGRASRRPERQQAWRSRLEQWVDLEARQGAATLVRQRDPLWQLPPPLPRQQITLLGRLGCIPATSTGCMPGIVAARGQRHRLQSAGVLPRKRWRLLSPMLGLDGCLRAVPGTCHASHRIRLCKTLGGWLCCLDRPSDTDSAIVPPNLCNFAQCCLDCRERLQRTQGRPSFCRFGRLRHREASSHVKRGKDIHGTTGPESGTRGMRGSKPAGFTGVGERAARSLDITLVQKRIGGLQNYASPGLAVLGSRRPGPPAPAQAGTRGAQIYIPKYQRTRSPRTITAQIL